MFFPVLFSRPDPDVLLQCSFTGNSGTDESMYNSAFTSAEYTLTGNAGFVNSFVTAANPMYLRWTGSQFGATAQDSRGWTLEVMYKPFTDETWPGGGPNSEISIINYCDTAFTFPTIPRANLLYETLNAPQRPSFRQGGSDLFQSGTAMTLDTLNHLAITCSQSNAPSPTFKFYLNGIERNSATGSQVPTLGTNPNWLVELGAHSAYGSKLYHHTFDYVRLKLGVVYTGTFTPPTELPPPVL